jgi:hypothetical protein
MSGYNRNIMKLIKQAWWVEEAILARLRKLSLRTMAPASAYVRKFLKAGLDREERKNR